MYVYISVYDLISTLKVGIGKGILIPVIILNRPISGNLVVECETIDYSMFTLALFVHNYSSHCRLMVFKRRKTCMVILPISYKKICTVQATNFQIRSLFVLR